MDYILKLCSEVRALLHQERILLKTARARETVELSTKKAEVFSALQAELAKHDVSFFSEAVRLEIGTIANEAKENSQYFISVRNGLEGVIARLGASNPNSLVGTYDESGRKVSFVVSTGVYQKKV